MPISRPEPRLLLSIRAALLTFVALILAAATAPAQRFSAPSTITTGDNPAAILAADFTGKGTPQLLALDAGASPLGGSVRVLANSRGVFNVGETVPTVGPAVLAMPLRPGFPPDLYSVGVAGNTANLRRANAQGDGTYSASAPLISFPLGGSVTPSLLLAAGSLQHVGYANTVIVADVRNNQLYTVLANPDGTYSIQPVYSYPGLPLIPGGTQLLTADINGDGVLDLLVAAPTGVQVFLAQSDGLGRFDSFSASTTYPCTGTVQSIALADMDSDTHPDLLVEGANGRIDIYHGNADGTFAAVSEVGTGADNAATGNGGHLVGVADLNADGIPDLVLANAQGITVLLGTGARNFQLNGTYASGYSPAHFVFADLNGDGKPDIAFDSPQGVTVMYAQNAAITGQLTATPEPSLYAADFTVTLLLTGSAALGAPTGTVTFRIDGATVGTGTLSNGMAAFTVTAPTYIRGQHTLQASYGGDTNYGPATVDGLHTVQGLPTTTTITDLVTPIYYGQEIGYTNGIDAVVSVIPASTAAPPASATTDGGLIYVYLDGQLVCSLTVGATSPTGGPQRCNDANFQGYPAGMHTMVAAYQGNGDYDPSTSPTYTVNILPDDTTTTLATSLTPAPYGTAVMFTAIVTAPYATPTGTVQFFDGPTLLGTATLSASTATFTASATYTSSTLAIGSHAITASYIPTPIPAQDPPHNFNPSQDSLTEVIYAVPAVTLTSSLNPSVFGQAVTFTATVGTSAGAAGSILFFVDGAQVVTVPLNAQGAAVYTTSSLSVGSHDITAFFSVAPSTPVGAAASLTQVVTAAAPPATSDFTLTVAPAALSIGVGNTGSTTVTVTETGSFSEPVALTCSGLPYGSTCTFVAPTFPAGGGITQLLIHPGAPHNCTDTRQYFIAGGSGRLALGLAAFASLLLLGWRKRRLRPLLVVAVACLLPMVGCGGNCTDLGTRPGTYSFTVTGAASGSASVSHSQTVTFRAFLDGEPH